MTGTQIEIQIIALITALACALPGIFLVLKRMALISDAISHSILIGIVATFFIVKDLGSPVIILGASLAGLLLVVIVEAITRSKKVKEDAAIALLFPVFFSLGVILVSLFASNIHLDIDAVLVGEIAYAPFDRMIIGGIDFGPRSLIIMGSILVLNIIFFILFYKEMKISTFDKAFAYSIGFLPGLFHYLFLGLVSITTVGAFDSVGAILVVALMIVPPTSAFLISKNLKSMIIYSLIIAGVSALSGYWIAHVINTNIAGAIASMSGIIFIVIFFFSPKNGMVMKMKRKKEHKIEFYSVMLLVHISHHENTSSWEKECHQDHLDQHLSWDKSLIKKIVKRVLNENLAKLSENFLKLTYLGKEKVANYMEK